MIPLSRAIEDYISYIKIIGYSKETICGYKKQLEYFRRYLISFYNYPPYFEEVTLSDIEGYLIYRKEKGDAACSRARMIYILRAFYNYMCKKGLCETNIAARLDTIKFNHKERDYLTESEINELIYSIDHPIIRVALQSIYYTGMRVSECTNLKYGDVDFDNNLIHITNGKGSKSRNIPMSNKLKGLLEEYKYTYRVYIKSEYFFATKKTGKISSCYINRKINEAVSKLGWNKKVSAHTLRHCFASTLIKNNVNVVNVQKLLGHASIKTTSIYVHCNLEELYETVNLL